MKLESVTAFLGLGIAAFLAGCGGQSKTASITTADVPVLVQADGSYPTIPLEKDSIVLKVLQTTVDSLSDFETVEAGLEHNLQHMEAIAEKACTTGNKPDFLLYHEFPLTGYSMPLSPTLDTVGAHGHNLSDVITVTEIICDKTFSGGVASEITLLDWGQNVICDDDVQSCFFEFVSQLGSLNTTKLSSYRYSQSRKAGLVLSEVEGYDFHKDMIAEDPNGFSDFFRGMLEYGHNLPKEKIDAAYQHVDALRKADFPDFILMPTAPQTAFKFGSSVPSNQADFTAFANLADRPAIQFPIGVNSKGLPIGAQLVGPRGREADLVAAVMTLPN